jgi:hypothetical protein
MKLIISAVFFVVLLAIFFLRERRIWRKHKEMQAKMEAELPKLVTTASKRYEKKYGRAPSSLEGIQAHHAKR